MSDTQIVEVLSGGETSVKVVRVYRRDANHVPREVSVRDERAPVAVMARRGPNGEWEPLYGVVGEERVDLPRCFSFNEAALLALDASLGNGRESSDDKDRPATPHA